MEAFGFRLISSATRWIVRIVMSSLLLLLFTCAGAGIFGIMPALTGLFAVTREWSRGRCDVKIAPLYWKAFRNNFVEANIIGAIYFGVACVLAVDINDLVHRHSFMGHVALIPSFFVVFVCLTNFIYIFPVINHYKGSAIQHMRMAAALVVARPLSTIALVLIVTTYALLLRGILPILGVSLVALCITWVANLTFNKIRFEGQ